MNDDQTTYLPRITLRNYSNLYEDWLGLANQFKSSIHYKRSMDDCRRLNHLKTERLLQSVKPNSTEAFKGDIRPANNAKASYSEQAQVVNTAQTNSR